VEIAILIDSIDAEDEIEFSALLHRADDILGKQKRHYERALSLSQQRLDLPASASFVPGRTVQCLGTALFYFNLECLARWKALFTFFVFCFLLKRIMLLLPHYYYYYSFSEIAKAPRGGCPQVRKAQDLDGP